MIFRVTQKLNVKIHGGRLSDLPLADNPYADWSAHVFTVVRRQYVLLSNTASLYSCVMPGRGITSESRFTEHAVAAIGDFAEADGQAFVYHRFIAPSCGSIEFAKALHRSVIGSMNELIAEATYWLEDGLPLNDVSSKLNGVPLSALDQRSGRGYGDPKETFKRLADGDMGGEHVQT